MKKSIVIDFFIANLSMFYVYTDSYEMSPTQRISEEIPRTKQVGVGEKTGDNEFYPSLAFILIRGILQSWQAW